jgi:hypothetical protein
MSSQPDARAKIERADTNINTLEGLIRTFAAQAYKVDVAYRIDVYGDIRDDPLDPPVGLVIIFAKAFMEPPSLDWGPIIGDIGHGYRSALDQLIWALSVEHQATLGVIPTADPIPTGDPWRSIAFPICVRDTQWPPAVRNQLWAINQTLVEPIKKLQPFYRGQHSIPEREQLNVLQELWNIDKHRHLHLINVSVELGDVLPITPFEGLPDTGSWEVVSRRAPGPLDDGGELEGYTEIGRVNHVPVPGGLLGFTLPEMHMDPRIAVDVAFDQGAPAYGLPVLQLLRDIGKTVEGIVSAF